MLVDYYHSIFVKIKNYLLFLPAVFGDRFEVGTEPDNVKIVPSRISEELAVSNVF